MDKNPPGSAGDTGLIPGLGDSTCHEATEAHATQLLSLHSITTGAHVL